MDLRVAETAEGASLAAAAWIAHKIDTVVEARGICSIALSGGMTPRHMLLALASEALPWRLVHVFQVDERIAPRGDPGRNLTTLTNQFLRRARIRPDRFHAMPVEAGDLHWAADEYATVLEAVAGRPPVLDIVHLGLGADGHTASLVPGDRVLSETDRDVALTGKYSGFRRLTLTFPCLARARSLIWLITGPEKAAALACLARRDPDIPASHLSCGTSTYFVDQTAHAVLGNPRP